MTTSLVSAPWATPEEMPSGAVAPTGGWGPLLADASDILYELSGRQWRGTGQSRVQITAAGVQPVPALPGWVPVPAGTYATGGWGLCGSSGLQLVKLPSNPVTAIDDVVIGGVTVDPTEYWCDAAGLLERADRGAWPSDGSMFVTFTHGIEPPEGGKRAALSLAVELAKAANGDGSCRLRNFQTITREGITMAAVNLRDALASGLTGLYEVDLWLKSVNPHAMRRRGGAWTPDMGRSRRVTLSQTSMLARGIGSVVDTHQEAAQRVLRRQIKRALQERFIDSAEDSS